MNFHSLFFILSLSMVNADMNTTQWKQVSDRQEFQAGEQNPLAKPFVDANAEFAYTAGASSVLIIAHDELKDADRRLGLDWGLKDVLTLGTICVESVVLFAPSYNTSKSLEEAKVQTALSAAEYLLTSQVLHIEF